jgi:hypothetical protein
VPATGSTLAQQMDRLAERHGGYIYPDERDDVNA